LRREASATFEIRKVHHNFEDEKTGISQSSKSRGSSDPELEKGSISDLRRVHFFLWGKKIHPKKKFSSHMGDNFPDWSVASAMVRIHQIFSRIYFKK